MARLAITARQLFDGNRLHHDAALIVDGGRVVELVARRELPRDLQVRDFGETLITPGLFDAQVNGGGGVLLNDDPTVGGVSAIAAAHRRFGTGMLLPTVITDATEVLRRAVSAVREARARRVPGIAGIHVEGPFLDQSRRGAHPAQHLRSFTASDFDWLDPTGLGVLLLTVSPAVVSADDIHRLAGRGIVVSLGHSDATADVAMAALAAGASGFTHLYNAMSQLTGRAPGMVGAALAAGKAWCGLIADGHHVDPTAIRVAMAAKPPGSLFLVSDAMPPAAGGPEHFALQGRQVSRRGGRLTLVDGTLAGSELTMAAAVHFAVGRLGVELAEALRMATVYPARALGLDASCGRLVAGGAADWVVFDDRFRVIETGYTVT